jgi:outer membrane receptor protein involved in Fe transport
LHKIGPAIASGYERSSSLVSCAWSKILPRTAAAARRDKNVIPVSTAEYNPCGWRAWLNNTTVTLGMNNIFDEAPPFVAGAGENGYDQATANIKGRTWYVALTKRF